MSVRSWLLGGLVALAGFFLWSDLIGCSRCARTVSSEQEARSALAAFFSSEIGRSRELVIDLRRDGLTDEHLAKLKAGCDGCYVYRGESKQNED